MAGAEDDEADEEDEEMGEGADGETGAGRGMSSSSAGNVEETTQSAYDINNNTASN